MMKHCLILICFVLGLHTAQAQSESTVVYIELYKKIAVQEMKRTGIPASITLAQGILESNSGESNLAKKFNNHFGIKCKSDWKGETTYQDDDTKQECFRVYPTALASFKDHSDFLKNRPNYAALFTLDPVDDSAWAYGLKKAGYATASDYPKRLLKIIDDYELSQYNFPELENEVEEETSKAVSVGEKVVAILPKKDTVVAIVKDTISTKSLDTVIKQPVVAIDSIKKTTQAQIYAADTTNISLSRVKGIESTNSTSNSEIPSMKGLGLSKDTVKQVLFTITKKKVINYPKEKFKINSVPVLWVKAGSSYLQIAQIHKLSLYKIFVYNDMEEADVVAKDQLVFIAQKKKSGNKSIHTAKEGETLYEISQNEGIQLSYLKSYNKKLPNGPLKEGTIVLLFKPKETKPEPSFRQVSLKFEFNFFKNLFKRKKK
ncbi:MAG: glycoside hydrolase family 73 protein [Chitinophagaceae bacterium]|jgi:LysM repeat protein